MSGRINREEYWWSIFALMAGNFVVMYALFNGRIEIGPVGELLFTESQSMSLLGIVAVGMYFSFTISVKRLHDMGWPGLLAVMLMFPVIGFIAFFMLGLMNGEKGTNKYGLEPPRLRR
ncbi:MAG: DUF805 domain-containing protein [Rhizobiales bacterium]|nr:DUF805 domain-containing protein [Hyphomicrobiales bacterium]